MRVYHIDLAGQSAVRYEYYSKLSLIMINCWNEVMQINEAKEDLKTKIN
jgi:hypothetical protein